MEWSSRSWRIFFFTKLIVETISFFSGGETSSPLAKIGIVIEMFLLFKNLLVIDQYIFSAVSESSNLTFTWVMYLHFDSVIHDNFKIRDPNMVDFLISYQCFFQHERNIARILVTIKLYISCIKSFRTTKKILEN